VLVSSVWRSPKASLKDRTDPLPRLKVIRVKRGISWMLELAVDSSVEREVTAMALVLVADEMAVAKLLSCPSWLVSAARRLDT
jgi:hypothetical protein